MLAILADPERGRMLKLLFAAGDTVRQCRFYRDYDEFIAELPHSGCGAVIVAMSGAGGMEAVRAARILCPSLPVVWLSDDRAFGSESYRLGCAYFSAAPLTQALIHTALEKCENERNGTEL